MRLWIAGAILLLALLGGGVAAWWYWRPPEPIDIDPFVDGNEWFADVTAESGVDFVHDVGDLSLLHQPQIPAAAALKSTITQESSEKG